MQALTIATAAGPLAGVLHLPARCPAPVVICCHGLLSSKDSSKYVFMAEELNKVGIAALRFDFSGCGESRAAVGKNLLGSRMRDISSVLQYVADQDWHNGTIGLMGSSLGGYLALLAAASATEVPIRAVVCWATPFDLGRVRSTLKRSVTLDEGLPQGMELGEPSDLGQLPPVERALIIHGQQDTIVPWREALALYRQVGEPKRLLLMQAAEHRFLHPECRRLALKATLDWFVEQGLVLS